MRFQNQLDGTSSQLAAAGGAAQHVLGGIAVLSVEPQLSEVDCPGTRLLSPVEDGQHRLARTLLEQKQAGLLVLWRIAQQIDRRGGASQAHHVEEISILQESQAL